MRLTQLVSKKLKEKPSEAQLVSHVFLLRGGYVRPVANGIYSLLPPAQRICAKIENIIRQEMDALGGQEVKMPVVLPRELWEETNRYQTVGSELLRFSDRTNHGMLLAMTHEEAVVQLARSEVSSYKELPFMLYQIQTKFRDEARSRGGLIRVREFTMKDAYSFHTSAADLDGFYNQCAAAYQRIFTRVGLPDVVSIQSATGMMGGKVAHEYMLLADCGEDSIVTCDHCDYRANSEVAASSVPNFPEEEKELVEVATPHTKTIDDLSKLLAIPAHKMAKMVFYKNDKNAVVAVIIRGDLEVNESKLTNILQSPLVFANDDEIRACGAEPGFASGRGLKNCMIIADRSVAASNNLVCGANKPNYHLLNSNLHRDVPNAEIYDIATVNDGDHCPICAEGKIVIKRGIEVGNIFKLGQFYTKAMNMTYTDQNGVDQHPFMGCYGIGVGRLMASIIEDSHDDFGPIWPISVAPWQIQLNALQLDKEPVKRQAEELYEQLRQAGYEVLYDDRNLPAGPQFAEADLMGIPLRLVVSPRNLEKNQIEWKERGQQEKGLIAKDNVISFVTSWLTRSGINSCSDNHLGYIARNDGPRADN